VALAAPTTAASLIAQLSYLCSLGRFNLSSLRTLLKLPLLTKSHSTFAHASLRSFRRFDLSSLRTGIMAGSPCPVAVMRKVQTEMHMRDVTICYGMTETSPVSFQTCTEDSEERRVATVGRIHPHLEARVVDPQTGRTLPRGQVGELCVRGYSVMLGYWGDAAATAGAMDEGRWMHTGDLAIIDGQGYCSIVGRIKDMVIRGGENVYPREVEEFLHRHPAVSEVQVFGVPDAKWGEELCAWVRLRDGHGGAVSPEELRQWCRGRIAGYKIPRYVKARQEAAHSAVVDMHAAQAWRHRLLLLYNSRSQLAPFSRCRW
jgi:fatty-acyl-CoA synthase